MSYSDLIHLYFERSNALQSYWTVYVVVIGGLLAFSSLRKEPDVITTLLISILFAFFAYKNLGAIGDVTVQRLAVHSAIKEADTAGLGSVQEKALGAKLSPTLNPPALDGIQNFHILSDLITLAALWAMELRRRRKIPA